MLKFSILTVVDDGIYRGFVELAEYCSGLGNEILTSLLKLSKTVTVGISCAWLGGQKKKSY